MKKLYSLYFFIALFFFTFFTSSVPEPSNPPTANTGAPGETTCQQTNCHGGGNYIGTSELLGLPDTLEANKTYQVTIAHKSDSAIRTGFQVTALDDGHASVGTLAIIPNERVSVARDNVTSRFYARHSQARFFDANGEAKWIFNYTAPASVFNDSILFYYTALLANGDGNKSGDNVVKFRKKFHFRLPVANKDIKKSVPEIILYNHGTDIVFIGNTQPLIHSIVVSDLQGHVILRKDQLDKNHLYTGKLPTGIYIVHFIANDSKMSKKIYVK